MEQNKSSDWAELDVMRDVAEALGKLDESARKRVLKWTLDRFAGGTGQVNLVSERVPSSSNRHQGEHGFSDLPSFFSAISPSTQSEKALVAGYWFQVVEGQSDLDSQQINTQLKNLGHGAANITRALEDLINSKPQLVIQTRKSGSSQQARKKYRLTAEGIARIKQMLARAQDNGGGSDTLKL
jgi:hypothetical protein